MRVRRCLVLSTRPRRDGQSGFFVSTPLLQFRWVDALLLFFRRAKNIRLLLRLRFIPTNRRDFTCRLGALACFLYALLNAGEFAGHRRSIPRKIMPSVLSLRSNPEGNIILGLSRQPCRPAGCLVGFGVLYEKVRC